MGHFIPNLVALHILQRCVDALHLLWGEWCNYLLLLLVIIIIIIGG